MNMTQKFLPWAAALLLLASLPACGTGTIGGLGDPEATFDGGGGALDHGGASSDSWMPGGDGSINPSPKSKEICNNGIDDDGDGDVDELCACSAGSSQACFPGPATQKGVGICKSGTQQCTGSGEFSAWGSCEGATLPAAEICGDGIDQDCNGKDEPCPAQGFCETFTFGVHSRPVDIVWVIDQSGSMTSEIAGVKANMNAFAQFISAQKVDYHVLVLAQRGTGTYDICIPQPLGGPNCTDGQRFRQISQRIGSRDSLAKIQTYIGQLEGFMRPGSIRHFIAVTDDESSVKANDFHQFIKSRGPDYADYVFHGIVGLNSGGCVARPGQQYVDLANMTHGLKFHICNANWAQLFNALGKNVATATSKLKLSKKPIPGSIQVWFDNFQTSQGSHWTYDPVINQIVIVKYPQAGAKIRVCYKS
ncbi:MAG: VWA domain-containing protein [Deltaproteobacteria bacterium]|nr:VWA domain-containing protein [Deltaproteobacteria bacterium]